MKGLVLLNESDHKGSSDSIKEERKETTTSKLARSEFRCNTKRRNMA
jgi:hypothetical protein